jgi:hypothetical protein
MIYHLWLICNRRRLFADSAVSCILNDATNHTAMKKATEAQTSVANHPTQTTSLLAPLPKDCEQSRVT